jgi:hypothetical protein
LPDVLNGLAQAFISTQNMIEGFVLPNGSGSAGEFVDATRRGSFDGPKNFRQGERLPLCIPQCGEEQMHVIGHGDRSMEADCLAVVVKAVLQGQYPGIG